jgi:hypothetical protein
MCHQHHHMMRNNIEYESLRRYRGNKHQRCTKRQIEWAMTETRSAERASQGQAHITAKMLNC